MMVCLFSQTSLAQINLKLLFLKHNMFRHLALVSGHTTLHNSHAFEAVNDSCEIQFSSDLQNRKKAGGLGATRHSQGPTGRGFQLRDGSGMDWVRVFSSYI